MPENESIERIGANAKARIEQLEKTVKALLSGMKTAEDEIGEALMPEGTYYGVKFED